MATENRDESAEKGFEMILNSFNYSKKRSDALDKGKAFYYFIVSDFGGLPIEQEVIDRHPEEYIRYLAWKKYNKNKIFEINNKRQEILSLNPKNKEDYLQDLHNSIEKSILEDSVQKSTETVSIKDTLENLS